MSPLGFRTEAASLLWLEPHRILADEHRRPASGLPGEDALAQALTALPDGPSRWVVDDLWAPSILLRDVVELPSGSEARDAFFKWRFQQALRLDTPQAVSSLALDGGLWLASGLDEALRESWMALALRLNRPLATLQPRWLWLYNQIAPSQDLPGLLLSLAPVQGGYTGTLAAWGRTLCLLRQWAEPLPVDGWIEERLAPSVAFLQREAHGPQVAYVWGAREDWSGLGLSVKALDEGLLRPGAEAP
jgi:hypothetical protein